MRVVDGRSGVGGAARATGSLAVMSQPEPVLLEDDELDLRAYLGVLRRRWKAIAVVVVLAVAAALGLSLSQEAEYRAESELLIRQNASTQVISDTPVVNANEAARQLNNEVRLFESGAVEAAVADVYEGPLDPDDVKASVSSDTSDVVRATMTATTARTTFQRRPRTAR